MDNPSSNNSKPEIDPTINFAAGTVAGVTSLFVGFPFDTVKTRFQDIKTAGRYASTTDAFKTIIKEEGVSGMFKGLQAPVLGFALLNGLMFGTYGFLVNAQLQPHQSEPTLFQTFLAGSGCGVVSSVITCPTEVIKIRQQETIHTKPPNAWQIANHIYREKGARGFFRGYVPTAGREMGYGVYFLTYETVCRYFRTPSETDVSVTSVPWYGVLLAGGLAGPASWLGTFPFDVVKTRMQALPEEPYTSSSFSSSSTVKAHLSSSSSPKALFTSASGSQQVEAMVASVLNRGAASASSVSSAAYREKTFLETVADCYRRGGAKVFVSGLTPTLIRAVPVNIVNFGAFELALRLFANGNR